MLKKKITGPVATEGLRVTFKKRPQGIERGLVCQCLGIHPWQRVGRETGEPKASQLRLWACPRNREEARGLEGGSRRRG